MTKMIHFTARIADVDLTLVLEGVLRERFTIVTRDRFGGYDGHAHLLFDGILDGCVGN